MVSLWIIKAFDINQKSLNEHHFLFCKVSDCVLFLFTLRKSFPQQHYHGQLHDDSYWLQGLLSLKKVFANLLPGIFEGALNLKVLTSIFFVGRRPAK